MDEQTITTLPTIKQLAEAVEAYFKSQKYKSATISNYCRLWQCFIKYADERNVKHFSMEFGFKFALEHYGIGIEKLAPPHTNFERFVFRALRCLSEHQLHGMAYRRIKSDVYVWPKPLENIFIGYFSWLKPRVKRKTYERQDMVLRRFAEFITQNGCCTFDDLTMQHFNSYIESLQRYTKGTISDCLAKVKAFLRYIYNQRLTSRNLALLVPKMMFIPTAIPTIYTKEEISRLLSSVDRANPVGKRDYAILLLAAKLGIRTGDICNIQFSNIRWDANTIEIVQMKTGQPLVLPLLKDVGEAIIDYLKNGRPQSEENYLFIKHCAPYDKFSGHAALYQIMKKYLQLAKIPCADTKKAGLHALRHSLASILLEQETPLPVISEILGHINTNTTRIYTSIDITQLKKCALDVPSLANKDGVL